MTGDSPYQLLVFTRSIPFERILQLFQHGRIIELMVLSLQLFPFFFGPFYDRMVQYFFDTPQLFPPIVGYYLSCLKQVPVVLFVFGSLILFWLSGLLLFLSGLVLVPPLRECP